MDLNGYLDALLDLTADDLRCVALSVSNDSVTDEVDWWRATIAIDRAIRHSRCSRQAARAATQAAHRVQSVAAREGFLLPDADVTRVAPRRGRGGPGSRRRTVGAARRPDAPRALDAARRGSRTHHHRVSTGRVRGPSEPARAKRPERTGPSEPARANARAKRPERNGPSEPVGSAA